MDFPSAFTLFQSPLGTVRVEPPADVRVEGPSFGSLRFDREHVRSCSPMLVSHYRQNIDPSYAAPDPDAIVVVLEVEGMPRSLLGPFPPRDGVALGDAINRARGTLLFGSPDFSVSVSSDGAKLVVDTRSTTGRLMVPVPTAALTGISVRDNAQLDARHSIPTSFSPGTPRFLELSFTDGKPWLVGPLPPRDAANITFAFRTWRTLHPVDAGPNTVDEATLPEDTAPDGLTGLPKRSSFDAFVRRATAAGPSAFAIVAIDRMKLVNDYNGHQVGDEVIRKVAQTTRHVLRGTDYAVRWGSDQIGIVFTDMTMRGAQETLGHVLAAVRALQVKPGVRVTLSAGLGPLEAGNDIDKLTRRVEEALVAAKRAGRDRIVATV